MKRAALTLTSIVLLLCGVGNAQASPIVVNGGFEDPGFVTGWTVNNSGDMLLITGSTPYGNQHLEVGGLGGAVENSIHQVVAGFTPGLTYTLNFSTASQWAGGSGAEVEVSFLCGSSTPSQDFFAPAVAGWGSWNTHGYDFLATAASVDIQFKQITNGFDDVGLDNISISESPEPMSLALLGLGIAGLTGYHVRRRRQRATA
jgi:hypothetical protein